MRAICEDAPVRPAVAAREGTRFDVSVELEWVVLKALRKEPDRRYSRSSSSPTTSAGF